MITFTAYGTPIPKGSTKAFFRQGMRFPVVTNDNKRTKPWADTVKCAALDAIGSSNILFPDGPVRIDILFKLPRPKSLSKNVVHHVKKPDVDKLTRAIFDSLTGVIWTDDSQVVDQHSLKTYAADGEMPGAHITIQRKE
jgi:crossover junction endodeoxyribonuclease RusA